MVYRDAVHGFSLDVASSDPALTRESIRVLAEDFVEYLTRAVAAPDTAVAAVGIVSVADRREIEGWSRGRVATGAGGSGAGSDAGATLNSLLRTQVSRTPDAVAVVDDAGTELTYRAFDERVDAMTALLLQNTVIRGDRVAVALPRSIDLVVALHAIVRAGAAYVPIDPDYPSERIAHILTDAAPAVIVTDTATAGAHQDVFTASLLLCDDPDTRTRLGDNAVRTVVPSPPAPADTAYVIFTSGTTGRPKGVQVNHAAIVNRLTWTREDHALAVGDRLLLKTPVTFDVSVPEFFAPLASGATVVVAADQGHKDPTYLADIIERHRITVAHFVPAMLGAFLDTDIDPSRLTSLRRVFFSGEALSRAAAVAALDQFPEASLFNLYGPTEATVEVTGFRVDRGVVSDAPAVPIGSPVAGTYVRVLDSWLRPVPVGTTGELYLGGVQLADGYVGRPGLTSDRFVADPSATTGERLYRTGDLVRWNPVGALDYLGRSDDQVKIRGFRIELDDIRTVLETAPTVTSAVVVALEHPAGGKYLAAYIVADSDVAADAGVLHSYLADRLPDYMVPATITELEAFPTTTSGKLDRRALPTPDIGIDAAGRSPRSETETAMARVFSDILHLPDGLELTVDDDFFHLGGDSLTATRVVARVNTEFRSTLTLREVFDARTVGSLAVVVDGAARLASPRVRVPDVIVPECIPASYGQQSVWLTDQLGGPRSRYVVPAVVRLGGDLDASAMARAIVDVVRRHEALRTLLVSDGGDLLQVIVPPDVAAERVSIDVTDLRDAEQSEVDERIGATVRTGFDVAKDIPFRSSLLRTGAHEWMLVVAAHHHAIDEWSIPVLLEELSSAYTARRSGHEPKWESLPATYAHYATWQRQVLGDPADPESELSHHLGYWLDELSSIPEESVIAHDRPRPAEPSHRGAAMSVAVGVDVVEKLRACAVEHGVTMFAIAQAATAITASVLGAGSDVVIGSPVGGRSEQELHGLVGYFVNTLPLRHRLEPAHTILDVVKQAQQVVLDGFAHQHAPFEEIVRVLGVAHVANRTPLYQIMLTQTNVDTAAVVFDGLDASDTSRLPAASLDAVKTDLEIHIEDDGAALTVHLSYSVDLFDRGTIDRFASVLSRVLSCVSSAPHARIASVDVVSARDRGVLRRWSTGRAVAGVDADATLDSLVCSQVRRSPDAVAVVDDAGTELTYRV
ncbi:hypothetical protein CH300_28000, partial [Rhodococcus sp. 15-1154-1]